MQQTHEEQLDEDFVVISFGIGRTFGPMVQRRRHFAFEMRKIYDRDIGNEESRSLLEFKFSTTSEEDCRSRAQ